MVREVYVKSVLNKHRRRDEWFLDEYSINPYIGCSFNCTYCYVYGGRYGYWRKQGFSVKVNAPRILSKELSRIARKGGYGFIAIGSATEPWMPIEERYMVTRRCLEVVLHYRFPIHCLTKSTLILRDIDLLREISEKAVLPLDLRDKLEHGVLVTVSLSTIDKDVARLFEPGAPDPFKRLEVLSELREHGLCAGLAFIPLLPFISDTLESIEDMVKAARDYRASYVFFGCLTLDEGVRERYYSVLRREYPELIPRYERLYSGKWYPLRSYQDRVMKVASSLCKKYGLRMGII